MIIAHMTPQNGSGLKVGAESAVLPQQQKELTTPLSP
jgi:hypothetical protein